MKYLNKPGDNIGGLIKLWAIPTSAFSTDNNIVNFSDRSNIYEIYCSPESMGYNEEIVTTTARNHYECSFEGFIPQNNASLRDALNYLIGRKWGIIYIDGNENFNLAGYPDDPLRFSYKLSTGKETSSLAGCSIQFFGKCKKPSLLIVNPFLP